MKLDGMTSNLKQWRRTLASKGFKNNGREQCKKQDVSMRMKVGSTNTKMRCKHDEVPIAQQISNKLGHIYG